MDSLSSVLIFHKDNENRKLDNFRQKKIEGLGEYFGAYYIHNTFTQSTKSIRMSDLVVSYHVGTIIRIGINASNRNYE